MSLRRLCPSCQAKLPPLALECPVCGLPVPRQAPLRPLLFQASGLTGRREEAPRQAISAPAFGRVAPVPLAADAETEPLPSPSFMGLEEPSRVPMLPAEPGISSLWVLARLEFLEATALLGLNLVLALLVRLSAGAPLTRIYGELWFLLLVLHLAISWAFFMVPITLTGQSLLMARAGLLVDADQPERRLSFSLFHLLSVMFFPFSFLCMVLIPGHRTLSELVTGQEIMAQSR